MEHTEHLIIWLIGFAIFATIVTMQWNSKLPTIQSVQELASVLNSRGGNIIVLFIMSIMFFFTGMRFIYWIVDRMIDGKLTADNAIVMTGVNWVTGVAFGMALSSLLKAMTGESTRARTSDLPDGNGSTSVTVKGKPADGGTTVTVAPSGKEVKVEPSPSNTDTAVATDQSASPAQAGG